MIFFISIISTLLLTSCFGTSSNVPDLKGSNANIIIHFDAKKAKPLLEAMDKSPITSRLNFLSKAIFPKNTLVENIKTLLKEGKDAKFSLSIALWNYMPSHIHFVSTDISPQVLNFLSNIKMAYLSENTASKSEVKELLISTMKHLQKKDGLFMILKDWDRFGKVFKSALEDGMNEDEVEFTKKTMEAIKISNNTIIGEIQTKSASKKLEGKITENTDFQALKKHTSGDEFFYMYEKKDISDDAELLLVTSTIHKDVFILSIYKKTKEEKFSEIQKKEFTEMQEKIIKDSKNDYEIKELQRISPEIAEYFTDIVENMVVSLEYPEENIAKLTVTIPVKITEISEKFEELFEASFMEAFTTEINRAFN